MGVITHFHIMPPLSSRLGARWSASIVPLSLFCPPLSKLQNKSIYEQGKNSGENVHSHSQIGTVAANHAHFTAWCLALQLPSIISRVTINTAGPSSVRDPEGWQNPWTDCQQGMGTCQIVIELPPRDTSYCNHTLLLQRPGWD